jgi:hypothetical protein
MSKLRRVGDIMLDMEPLLLEMAIDHDMQRYEILALVFKYLELHAPSCLEAYEDGQFPVHYYGHPDGMREWLEKAKK